MRRVLLALTTALTTATAVGAVSVPAHAADYTNVGYVYDGSSTKGNWTYNNATNKLCAKTFTGGQTSTHLVVNPGSIQRAATSSRAATASDFQTTGQFSDAGGDDAPTCVRLKTDYDGRVTVVQLSWNGSGSGRAIAPSEQFVG